MPVVSLPSLTLLDAAILLACLLSVLGAIHRGIAKEMVHTVLFGLLVIGGYVTMQSMPAPSADNLSFWVSNISYYLITAYALTWVIMTVVAPLMLGRHEIGYRSRFWAGVVSIVKIAAVVLGLNLWFAVHSPYAYPAREQSLPEVMQDSVVIQHTDAVTETLYQWLVAHNLLDSGGDKHVDYKKPEASRGTSARMYDTHGNGLIPLRMLDSQTSDTTAQ